MSLTVHCDHCKHQIFEVAYVLCAVDAQCLESGRPIVGPNHLHWDCVPMYGRSARSEAVAEKRAIDRSLITEIDAIARTRQDGHASVERGLPQ